MTRTARAAAKTEPTIPRMIRVIWTRCSHSRERRARVRRRFAPSSLLSSLSFKISLRPPRTPMSLLFSRIDLASQGLLSLIWRNLGASVLSKALLVVMSAAACGSSAATLNGQTAPARCGDGRPQSEIDAAGLLPLEPHSQRIACIQIAEGTDRAYRLADGRSLQLYEHIGALPAKPSRSPTDSGVIDIGTQSWSWTALDAYLVLSTETPNGIYVELGLSGSGGRSADIDLLKEIAATLAVSRH